MEIFKIVIGIVVFISLVLYIGELEVSFDPFIFKINRPLLSCFILLSCLALMCLSIDMYNKGKNDAKNEVVDKSIESVK